LPHSTSPRAPSASCWHSGWVAPAQVPPLAGVAAIVGHVYPVVAGFSGEGKAWPRLRGVHRLLTPLAVLRRSRSSWRACGPPVHLRRFGACRPSCCRLPAYVTGSSGPVVAARWSGIRFSSCFDTAFKSARLREAPSGAWERAPDAPGRCSRRRWLGTLSPFTWVGIGHDVSLWARDAALAANVAAQSVNGVYLPGHRASGQRAVTARSTSALRRHRNSWSPPFPPTSARGGHGVRGLEESDLEPRS